VYKIKEYSVMLKELNNYIDLVYGKNDPVQIKENQIYMQKMNDLKLFMFLTNFINDLSNLRYIFDFYYNINFSMILSDSNHKFKLDTIERVEIGGSLKTEEYNKFKKYFDNINNDNFIFKLKEIKTININIDFPANIYCKVCKNIIPNDKELYYCYFCKDFYCYKCVKDNFESKSGKEKFIDQKHNLLFFKTRNKNLFLNIEEHKLGKNTFTTIQSFKSYHSASCDGCSSSFDGSPRYICITCKPGIYLSGGYNDYCDVCIEHMMKNDDAGKKMQKDIKTINYNSNFVSNHILRNIHNHENHIYLMVALEGIGTTYQGF
jgi:hypothetical protein